MTDTKDDWRREVALFRYQVIAPLLDAAPGTVRSRIDEIADKTFKIPASQRTRIAPNTLYEWLLNYRRGGFDALLPKRRTDRSLPRRLPSDVIEGLIRIRNSQPLLSIRKVIAEAYRSGLVDESYRLPPSTVHRLFQREGLMTPKQSQAGSDHRRFAYEWANEMWQSDVLHGPQVKDENGRRRKVYLLALLDDATRLVPHAAFSFNEKAQSFLPLFRTALERRGIPKRCYADNGATYRSQHLQLVCARLGIAMIHAKPYSPAGKGKIERWLRTVREQFLANLSDTDLDSLETLNACFWTWLEGEYHRTPHCGLGGVTPIDKWMLSADQVRYVDAGVDLYDLFLFEVKRKVKKDHTVQLNSLIYEVQAGLSGEIVTLRYDPAAPVTRPLSVVHQGKASGDATLVDLHANARLKRTSAMHSLQFRNLTPKQQED